MTPLPILLAAVLLAPQRACLQAKSVSFKDLQTQSSSQKEGGKPVLSRREKISYFPERGVLPYKRLVGMCRWMGLHFHDWIDYNGVAHVRIFWGKTVLYIYG